MPIAVSTNNIDIVTYTKAGDIPNVVVDLLQADDRNANIILPFILEKRTAERQGHAAVGNLWLVVSTYPDSRSDPVIDFIVAATNGALGEYPIFIYHTRPLVAFGPAYLGPRMKVITQTLVARLPYSRVFSVFAVEPVTRAFVSTWTKTTGINVADAHIKDAAEYYSALLTPCDRRSFRNRSVTMHPIWNFNVRRATREDIPIVARLCYEFAQGSVSRC